MLTWLQKRKFEVHLTSFVLMVLASVGLYFAASAHVIGLIWGLLGLFALGNLLTMAVK